jgi:hypothetical protein
MLWPDDLTRIWARVSLAKQFPRVTFHALRHTHASMLIASGLDVLTISRRPWAFKAKYHARRVRPFVQGRGRCSSSCYRRPIRWKLADGCKSVAVLLLCRSPKAQSPCISLSGEVPEWSNGTVSKTVVRVTVPWVRIPPSPPTIKPLLSLVFTPLWRRISFAFSGPCRRASSELGARDSFVRQSTVSAQAGLLRATLAVPPSLVRRPISRCAGETANWRHA